MVSSEDVGCSLDAQDILSVSWDSEEELINYFVGQVVGSMNQVKSVRSVVEELVQEYADTMERLDDWAQGKEAD